MTKIAALTLSLILFFSAQVFAQGREPTPIDYLKAKTLMAERINAERIKDKVMDFGAIYNDAPNLCSFYFTLKDRQGKTEVCHAKFRYLWFDRGQGIEGHWYLNQFTFDEGTPGVKIGPPFFAVVK